MRDRVLTTLDEAAIKAEVAECAERFRRDNLPNMRAGAARLAPHVAEIYRRAWKTRLPDELDRRRHPPVDRMRQA